MDLLEEAKGILPLLKEYRRTIHGYAEVGLDTPKTNAFIEKALYENGITPSPCGCGVYATIGEGKGGILLRADTDALPLEEASSLSFAAKGNSCHACGHDMHSAMLLGAAVLLSKRKDTLPYAITLMFQPAEEILKGALSMIEDNILKNEPCFAYALHVMTATDLPTGTLVVAPTGKVTAASDFFSVSFHGQGAHGAMPERAANPLIPASRALLALNDLADSPHLTEKEALLTVCMMEGAKAYNVIPSTAILGGSFRTHDEEARTYLLKRIPALCQEIGAPYGICTCFSEEAHCPPLQMNAVARERALAQIRSLCAAVPIKELPPFTAKPRGGSEDFAYVSERIPSCFFSLAAGGVKDGYSHPLHHPAVRFDEGALAYGAAALAAVAL